MFRVTCILENYAFELVEFEINEAEVMGTVAELYERGDSQPFLLKTSPEMIKKVYTGSQGGAYRSKHRSGREPAPCSA